MVVTFKAPHSYTGEDTTEISCHGSRFIIGQILKTLVEQGCRQAGPGEEQAGHLRQIPAQFRPAGGSGPGAPAEEKAVRAGLDRDHPDRLRHPGDATGPVNTPAP